MCLKFLFDRLVSLIGLLFLWPLLIVVAILIKIKMLSSWAAAALNTKTDAGDSIRQ